MTEKKISGKFLLFGSGFLVIGVLLLLYTTGTIPQLGKYWPVTLIAAGLIILYQVFVKKGWESYVFFGMIMTLSGIFFLLLNTVLTGVGVRRIWPVFMFITAVSLFSYGMRKKGANRISLILPALFFAFLSVLFLPFSLDLTDISFAEFVAVWWPGLFVLAGLALILSHVLRKNERIPDESKTGEENGLNDLV